MEQKRDDNKIGLWEKKSEKVGTFFSGSKDGIRYTVFPNQYFVEGSNKPKYNLVMTKIEPKVPVATPVDDDLPF